MQEYDAVRVIRLNEDGRHYDGTEGVMRPPEIGDIGTIVHAADKNSFTVEKVGPGGYTFGWPTLLQMSWNSFRVT
jgi:hypothetical protein